MNRISRSGLIVLIAASLAVPAVGKASEAPAPEAAPKSHEGSKGGRKERQFVRLDPLVIPVIENNKVRYRVSIAIVLEMTEPAMAPKVDAKMPRLIDSYQRDLYGVLSGPWQDDAVRLDVEKVKERLFRITQDILGEGIVRQVLLDRVIEMRS